MKKSIIFFSTALITLSLVAFSFIDFNGSVADQVETSSGQIATSDIQVVEDINYKAFPDFFYAVGTRFGAIKKGDLDKARSIHDFLPEQQIQGVVSYKSVSVIIMEGDRQTDTRETGNSDILTAAQIELLQSSGYSTNFLIRADYQKKNKVTGQLEYSYSTPHLTIVPEKQAVYISGKDVLIEYLKENNKAYMPFVQKDKLQPAKLYFTVTKKGKISKVKLDRTSGYPSIDEKMIELITKAPGMWEPAENSKGEKVDQELVISFGLMGC